MGQQPLMGQPTNPLVELMASTINPATIDTTKPAIGAALESTPMRNNFNAIKDNFTATKADIELLQAVTGGKTTLAALAIEIGKLIFPIGAIYFSKTSTNPATLLGFGTWVLHGAGRGIVCIDPAQTEFDAQGKTGGAKTHTLTANQSGLRSHTHGVPSNSGAGQNVYGVATAATPVSTQFATQTVPASDALEAHNNLQPYIVDYVWERTA